MDLADREIVGDWWKPVCPVQMELKSERASSARMMLFIPSQTEHRAKCSRKKSVQMTWLQINSDRMALEAELLARCRRGDAGAWDELFDLHYAAAGRFVFQLAPDFSREDSEEICQEAFLSVIKNLDSFQGESQFQTWLFRIAANKARDYREKRDRRQTRRRADDHFAPGRKSRDRPDTRSAGSSARAG